MDSFSEFSSKALVEFSNSALRKRKSLNNLFNYVNLSREDRSSDGSNDEIAVLTLRTMKNMKSPTITVNVWPDRWAWVDMREGSNMGWLWSFTIEGRLAGNKNWDDLIQELKVLPSEFREGSNEERVSRIRKRWMGILVSGPLGRISS